MALLVAPQAARADSKLTAAQTQSAQGCGTTVEDKLAAAQRALQSNDKAPRAALVCLIEATSALNDKLRNDERGRQQSGMLAVPSRPDAPKLNQ